MARAESNEFKNGTKAPNFTLLNTVDDSLVSLENAKGEKGTVILFICNHCPFVIHVNSELVEENFPFPYLFDETQEVAKAYDAACTPDFYVFDADLKSVYHGQLDNSRPGNGKPVTGIDLRNALDNLVANKPDLEHQKPSVGCGIKWK